MRKVQLSNDCRTMQTLKVLRQGELDQSLRQVAQAMEENDRQRDRLQGYEAQCQAILQAHSRQTGAGAPLALHELVRLARQYQAAQELKQAQAKSLEHSRQQLDELRAEAARVQGRQEAADRRWRDVRQALSRERDVALMHELDDLWLSRCAWKEERA